MENNEPLIAETDVRVRFILPINGKIVFIHRITAKNPDGYYILPGGGVDPGETPEIALLREAREELNLDVDPVKLLFIAVHEDSNGKHTQLFYHCDHISGEISVGSGVENTPEWQAEHGTHAPVLINPADIASLTIYPRVTKDYLVQYAMHLQTAPFMTLYNL
jgi:8-oxo-dGTP pyrophosphatase MutT (NUDIX family)